MAGTTETTETLGDYTLSVVRNGGALDDSMTVLWAIVAFAIDALTSGWLSPGADANSRWLVQVTDRRTDDIRTVRTALTRWGTRRQADKVRSVLLSGDRDEIAALPDVLY